MVENVHSRRQAFEIEIAVVVEIDDGRSAGSCLERDRESGRTGEPVRQSHVEPAGIVLLAVRTDVVQRHRRPLALVDLEDLPELAIEAVRAAVQCVRAVIGCELDGLTVEHQATIRDAVGIAADAGAEELPLLDIAGQIVMAEHDVVAEPVAARNDQRLQRGAEADDARLETSFAVQYGTLDGAADWQRTEQVTSDPRACRA